MTNPHPPKDRSPRTTASRLAAPGIAAAALIAAAAIASAVMLPGLLGSLLIPAPAPVTRPADAAQDHAARMEAFRKQTDGRTMFFVPAEPPPKPVAVAENGETGPAPPPPPPATYGGPAPIAMVFDTVWFADGQQVKVGQDGKSDLHIVRLEPPWAAVMTWKGVEFTVKVFERDSVVLKARGQKMAEGTAPEPRPTPPPEAAPGTPSAPPPPASGDPPSTPPADPAPVPAPVPATTDPATTDPATELAPEPSAAPSGEPETNP